MSFKPDYIRLCYEKFKMAAIKISYFGVFVNVVYNSLLIHYVKVNLSVKANYNYTLYI